VSNVKQPSSPSSSPRGGLWRQQQQQGGGNDSPKYPHSGGNNHPQQQQPQPVLGQSGSSMKLPGMVYVFCSIVLPFLSCCDLSVPLSLSLFSIYCCLLAFSGTT
jgi:hypothetical protein